MSSQTPIAEGMEPNLKSILQRGNSRNAFPRGPLGEAAHL